jgi:hypothetical protein
MRYRPLRVGPEQGTMVWPKVLQQPVGGRCKNGGSKSINDDRLGSRSSVSLSLKITLAFAAFSLGVSSSVEIGADNGLTTIVATV